MNTIRIHKITSPRIRALLLAACTASLVPGHVVQAGLPPVTNGLVLQLDAQALTGLTNGSPVITWPDTSGSSNNAVIDSRSTSAITYVLNGPFGHPVLLFSIDAWFNLNTQISDVRSVFWVLQEFAPGYHNMLAAYAPLYDFDRGENPPYYIWDSGYANVAVKNGTTRLNGAAVDGTATLLGSTWNLLDLVTTDNVNAKTISQDWGPPNGGNVPACSWYGYMGEILIYNTPLSDGDVASVEAYLNQKWRTASALPSTVTNLTAVSGDSQVTLTWAASLNATGYNIKRSTSSGTETYLDSSVDHIYTDLTVANETKYYYVVTATNNIGESSPSAEVSVAPLPVPTGLTPTPDIGQITLSWNPTVDATSYNVKRSTSSGTETTFTNLADTTFIDTNVAATITYYYEVSALTVYGESGNSTETNATPVSLDLTWSGANPGVWATASVDPTAINWTKATLGGTAWIFGANAEFNDTGSPQTAQIHGSVTANNLTVMPGATATVDGSTSTATNLFQGALAVNSDATLIFSHGSYEFPNPGFGNSGQSGTGTCVVSNGAHLYLGNAPWVLWSDILVTGSNSILQASGILNFMANNGLVTIADNATIFTTNCEVRIGNYYGPGYDLGVSMTVNQTGGAMFAAGNQRVSLGVSYIEYTNLYYLSGGTVSILGGGNANLEIAADASGDGLGMFSMTGGKLLVSGNVWGTQGAGAQQVFDFSGGTLAVANIWMDGNLSSGGPITGTDSLTNNGGVLAPGDTNMTGRTTIHGSYVVYAPGAVLDIDLGGTNATTGFQSANGYDNVQVSGTAILGGNLNVRLLNGFDPTGLSFTILTADGGVSGSFANVTGNTLTLSSGATFSVTISGTMVVLDNYHAAGWTASPTIRHVGVSGGSLSMNGTGGTPGATYYVLSSAVVNQPRPNWTTVYTNSFDGTGAFSLSLPVAPGQARQFYLLSATRGL